MHYLKCAVGLVGSFCYFFLSNILCEGGKTEMHANVVGRTHESTTHFSISNIYLSSIRVESADSHQMHGV